jgi:hypothetical protein
MGEDCMNTLRSIVVLLGLALASGAALAQEPVKIKVGWGIPVENVKYIMMKKPEILKHHGRVYTVDWVNFPTTPPQAQALAAGRSRAPRWPPSRWRSSSTPAPPTSRWSPGSSRSGDYFSTTWLVSEASGSRRWRSSGKTIGTSVWRPDEHRRARRAEEARARPRQGREDRRVPFR